MSGDTAFDCVVVASVPSGAPGGFQYGCSPHSIATAWLDIVLPNTHIWRWVIDEPFFSYRKICHLAVLVYNIFILSSSQVCMTV